MEEQFPQKDTFDEALCLNKISSIFTKLYLVLSFLIPLATYISCFNKYVSTITFYGGIVAILLMALKEGSYYFFLRKYWNAEKIRRMGFIENSFGIRLFAKESIGYYDNEKAKYGIKKMLANLHESVYFTNHIMKAMEPKMIKRVFVIICAILVLILGCHSRQYLVTVLGTINLFDIYIEYRSLNKLIDETDSILLHCAKLWDHWLKYENNEQLGEVIHIYNWYETTLANCRIIPDEKIYNQNKKRLSEEWEKIKDSFNRSE